MTFSEIIAKKSLSRDELKSTQNLPKRSKILVGIHFSDKKITKKIVDGLGILPANFIVFGDTEDKGNSKNISFINSLDDIDFNAFDALVCDCSDVKIEKIMQQGVVPIVNEKNYLGKILSEFHPGRAEGNAYLYQDNSLWSAYYALIRYLENHKFPYDNRNLVKNILGL